MSASNPLTAAPTFVALLLALVCLGATLVPAMRATHADPMTALRME